MSREATSATGRALTYAELIALPVAVDLVTAGRAWSLGRTKVHELARAGDLPFPVLRLGNQYRVTRADLLRSLGIDPHGVADGAPTEPPSDGQDAQRAGPLLEARPSLRRAPRQEDHDR
jgi:hypothetical protein